jgi:hypothetical protein
MHHPGGHRHDRILLILEEATTPGNYGSMAMLRIPVDVGR